MRRINVMYRTTINCNADVFYGYRGREVHSKWRQILLTGCVGRQIHAVRLAPLAEIICQDIVEGSGEL